MTVVVALLVVATAALRGYVPGAEIPQRRNATADSPVALATVVGLLVARWPSSSWPSCPPAPRAPANPARRLAVGLAARRGGRPTWRVALIAFGLLLGWLLLSLLVGRSVVAPVDDASGTGATPSSAQQAPAPGDPRPPPAPEPGHAADLLGYFYGMTVVFLLILVIGTIVASRRQRRPDPSGASVPDGDGQPAVAADGSDSLARAAEVGLAEVG